MWLSHTDRSVYSGCCGRSTCRPPSHLIILSVLLCGVLVEEHLCVRSRHQLLSTPPPANEKHAAIFYSHPLAGLCYWLNTTLLNHLPSCHLLASNSFPRALPFVSLSAASQCVCVCVTWQVKVRQSFFTLILSSPIDDWDSPAALGQIFFPAWVTSLLTLAKFYFYFDCCWTTVYVGFLYYVVYGHIPTDWTFLGHL